MLLTEYVGNDLSKIANELDKLIILLAGDKKTITTKDIEKNIGISKDYNNFELMNALAYKNTDKAFQIVHYFSKNQNLHPFPLTMYTLYTFFSKILIFHQLSDKNPKSVAANLKVHPYFVNEYKTAAKNYPVKKVRRIISAMREYDRRSKGINNVSTPSGELLKELIYIILY